jgi:hypothetical protein
MEIFYAVINRSEICILGLEGYNKRHCITLPTLKHLAANSALVLSRLTYEPCSIRMYIAAHRDIGRGSVLHRAADIPAALYMTQCSRQIW